MENEKEILENGDVTEAAVSEETAENVTETPETETVIPEAETIIPETAEAPEKKKSGMLKVVLITVASTIVALALLAGMAYLVLKGAGILEGKSGETDPVVTEPSETEPSVVTPDHSYTVDDTTIVAMGNNVVAKAGDAQLTNSEFQLYYESNIISYDNTYGMYLLYMGVDLSQSLDTQIFDESTGQTWQDIMIESAFQTWHAYIAVKQYAEANGFVPDEEGQADLDGIESRIQEMLTAAGCETVEQFAVEQVAPGATADALRNYMTLDTFYGVYLTYLEELYTLNDEDAVAYYTENEELLNENGISKENGDVVDVRHVLIQLEDSETDEMGQVVYTDEQWEECRVKAQGIYDSWLAGEATEDTFAQLAKDNSKDGNASEGGLYTDVTKDYMVETFDAWIFDESRVTGDSGLVKTPYGYHIMYFVSRKAQWIEDTRDYVISEKINNLIQEAMAAYPLETFIDQVGVSK